MPKINFTWFRNFKGFLNATDLKVHYQGVFKSPMGQEVLKDLYKTCCMNSRSYVVGSPDATAFNEGRRSVFLDITKKMGIDPEQLEQEICDE